MAGVSEAGVLPLLESLAVQAGAAIMDFHRKGYSVQDKPDESPVTEADRAAEAIVLAGLRRTYPDVPCIAEEEIAAGAGPTEAGSRFFLIDPLDGTREFVSGNADFTVNIALIVDGAPVTGVVYAPARGTLYAAGGGNAWRLDPVSGERASIRARVAPANPVILASRSHRTPETDAYITAHRECEMLAVGSSLKFCMIAEGKADLYPRHGRTMEWDTAAGDAVLRAAGGRTCTFDGLPLTYGKHSSDAWANPHFIASGCQQASSS